MEKSKDNLYIPERFEKVVTLHLLKNKLADGVNINPPLILGIDGLPGTGKTFQCRKIVQKLGYKEVIISGSQLESKNAGEPAELIQEKYINANYTLERRISKGAVIILDDLDVFLGDWGNNVQYTVNRQLVFGELMSMADNPYNVRGEKTKRIPIIITGNDFSKLYEPLTRPGRFERFTWIPQKEEIVAIATHILDFADKNFITKLTIALIDLYEKKGLKTIPISFFSHLKTTLVDDIIWEYYKKNPSIDYNTTEHFKLYFENFFKRPDFQQILLKKANELAQKTTFEKHFRT